jgi:transcriptional regulator with XRE-family HTH domain
MSLRTMAKILGIPHTNVRRYEEGEVKPGGDRLEQIAAALDTTMDYLNGRTDDPDPITPEDRRWLRDIHSTRRREAAFEEFRQKMLKENPGESGIAGKKPRAT